MSELKKIRFPRITFNAPATLFFLGACFAAFLLNLLSVNSAANRLLFSVYRSSWSDPLAYVRVFLHVLGHDGWSHLLGNMMIFMLLGTLLEERYGTFSMVVIFLVTALVTGVLFLLFGKSGQLALGSSGIVCAMIILASYTQFEDGSIPLTFLVVVALFIGLTLAGIFTGDGSVAYGLHLAGGLVGALIGWLMNSSKFRKA